MNWLPPLLIPLLIIGGWVYMLMRRNRERARNEPLRAEIAAQVRFDVNGQVFVSAGGQVKVPASRVDQVLFTVVPPLARAWRMR